MNASRASSPLHRAKFREHPAHAAHLSLLDVALPDVIAEWGAMPWRPAANHRGARKRYGTQPTRSPRATACWPRSGSFEWNGETWFHTKPLAFCFALTFLALYATTSHVGLPEFWNAWRVWIHSLRTGEPPSPSSIRRCLRYWRITRKKAASSIQP